MKYFIAMIMIAIITLAVAGCGSQDSRIATLPPEEEGNKSSVTNTESSEASIKSPPEGPDYILMTYCGTMGNYTQVPFGEVITMSEDVGNTVESRTYEASSLDEKFVLRIVEIRVDTGEDISIIQLAVDVDTNSMEIVNIAFNDNYVAITEETYPDIKKVIDDAYSEYLEKHPDCGLVIDRSEANQSWIGTLSAVK